MSFDRQTLFELLPAIHRTRDAELARAHGLERGPLEELVGVLAEQINVAEESLDQLYDDLFIETCADWVVPYIGDLIGYESLHPVTSKVASPRAEVAHTIALRRRKGTALVLEQLARDVTGWDARAVEYFQRILTTQYMNHPRLHNHQSPDLRQSEAMEWIDTPFETANRTVDVRRVESARGRHNIPNVGLHLWRIQAYPRRASAAFHAGPRRYRFSPLNHDLPLYNRPRAEDDISHLAEPDNVPWPLTRQRLALHLRRYYGEATADPLNTQIPSLLLNVDGSSVPYTNILVCDLSDDGADWAHTPPADGLYAIDPVLGRIALPMDAADPAEVRVTWHEGFSADIGGGEYERGPSLPTLSAQPPPILVPTEQPTIAAALTALDGNGVIEITDSSRYQETLSIQIIEDGAVEIRARNGRRPVLALSGLTITGGDNAACTLNGLLITGTPLIVPDDGSNALAHLNLIHCTLVPGIALDTAGQPTQAGSTSLQLAIGGLEARIERCIIGSVRSHEHASVSASDTLIDANTRDGVAFAELDGDSPGATLKLEACSVIGKVHATEMEISNSILLASLAASDTWDAPVRAERKQIGCVRFSWLPFESIVPTRHRCQPSSAEDGHRIAPRFTSLNFGTPAYGQLTTATPVEILRGADDEGEMGVFHHLYGARRETNLRIRLAEYLRVGLRAGIFYES